MSAYGAITQPNRPTAPLPSTVWSCPPRAGAPTHLTLHHLTLADAHALPGLVPYLHACFADELARGRTYPQEVRPGEPYTRAAFETYFFAADVILGLIASEQSLIELGVEIEPMEEGKGKEFDIDFDKVRQGRGWAECVAGFYYVSSGRRIRSDCLMALIFRDRLNLTTPEGHPM